MLVEYPDCNIEVMQMSDIDELVEHMRDQDVVEVTELGATPEYAVQQSFQNSHKKFSVRLNTGELVCSFGVGSVTDDIGMVWLLGTKHIKKIRKTFLKHSRDWLAHLMVGYDFVYNVVHIGNTTSVKWLKWLGAVFLGEPAPANFQYFRIGGDA